MGRLPRELLKKPIHWEDGYVIPSKEPGLGVELDEAVARAHPYTGNDLHLQMAAAAGRTDHSSAGEGTITIRYGFIGLGHLGRHLAAQSAARSASR